MPGPSPVARNSTAGAGAWNSAAGTCHCPAARSSASAPCLPQPYTCSERTLKLYTSELIAASGQSFFGSLQLVIQIHCTCRLWLVRDTRRGEKTHDQQRRFERFREQRPGG